MICLMISFFKIPRKVVRIPEKEKEINSGNNYSSCPAQFPPPDGDSPLNLNVFFTLCSYKNDKIIFINNWVLYNFQV